MPCRLKKRCYTCGRNLVPHPLVDPGNSPHRHEARTTAHPTRPRHRMVALAACPPGRGATRPPQKQNATVMLEPIREVVESGESDVILLGALIRERSAPCGSPSTGVLHRGSA